MTDEKTQEKKEQVKEEPKKPQAAAEKPEKKAPASEGQKPEQASEKEPEKVKAKEEPAGETGKPPGKKLRKISQMTLQEIEKELSVVKEKMGGFQSRFARHLLARKKELTL